MLRALVVRYKDVAGLVLNECREKLVHPDLVFLMLPFSEEIHVRGLQNYARFREISDDLERYLDYVKYFINRQMNRAGQTPRGQPHMRGNYWYEHFVVQIMLEAARPQEFVAYLEYLRIQNRLRDFVTRADRVLLAMHPEKTEDLLLRSWAVDDLDLKGAIGFMPWGDFHAPDARVAMDKEIVVDIRKRFRQVLKYVRLYREVQPLGRLDDKEVADALKYWSTSEELLAYRELLEGHLDEYGSFEKLVKVVGTFYPFTKKEIAKSKRIVADILRVPNRTNLLRLDNNLLAPY
ncbi:unnamed protein product [Hyaloperonospora brassicae]|uniref:RxLR effector candidate protein n=1 Tax=Hyaloperonospora brassicae TaxID=162125 RepID=A0AAV0TCL7_HYABA|nr:unnamed protein product [Hyaloperonospora brassicae]